MPLDTFHSTIHYLAGRLAALAYPDSAADIPSDVTAAALANPVTAIPMMTEALALADQEHVTEVTERIPADCPTFPRGARLELQGDFWTGYYHQRAATRDAKSLTPDKLRAIGEALWGERWQTDMASTLGFSDSARIRQFLSGARRPAPGVTADLLAIMRQRGQAINAIADEIEAED